MSRITCEPTVDPVVRYLPLSVWVGFQVYSWHWDPSVHVGTNHVMTLMIAPVAARDPYHPKAPNTMNTEDPHVVTVVNAVY